MSRSAAPFVLALMALPAVAADATSTSIDRIVACAAQRDAGARLACFDREVAPLTGTTVAPRPATGAPVTLPAPAPASTPPAPSTVPATPASTYGQEQLPASRKPQPSEAEQTLQAHIRDMRKVGSRYLLELDNGQTWRHEDEYQGAFLVKGEAVTIRKGAMGSYRLTRDAGSARNWIRVERVR